MSPTWVAFAPIADYADSIGAIGQGVDLASGVRLSPLPAWVKTEQATSTLGWSRRDRLLNRTWFTLYAEYQATADGTPDPDWAGPEPRSIQDTVRERLFLASLALWIARPSNLGFEVLIHFDRPGDPTSAREISSLTPVTPHHSELRNELTGADYALARTLHEGILSLTRKGTLWTAVRLLFRALTDRDMWESRFLMYWVAIESLFGSTDPREVTYRLSTRGAFFLSATREQARERFEMLRKGYGLRSKVVHGARTAKVSTKVGNQLSLDAETTLRESFIKILSNPALIAAFDGADREAFLDSLPFQTTIK